MFQFYLAVNNGTLTNVTLEFRIDIEQLTVIS